MMDSQIFWAPGVTLEQIEKQVIIKAFSHFRQNKTQTSIALGISIRTLELRLEKYENDDRDATDRLDADRTERAAILDRMRGKPPGQHPNQITNFGPPSLPRPRAGVYLEPAIKNSPEQNMPLPVGQEIQSVLPPQSPASHKSKGRR